VIPTLKDMFFAVSLRLANAYTEGANDQWSVFIMDDKEVAFEGIFLS
jgi:hypothetical protein